MKVLVPIKRVVDPYVKIRVKSDGTGVDTEQLKMVINPFDEIAIEEAIRWKEAKLITEIIVVSLGTSAVQESLRNGLALGADSALHYETHQKLEPLSIAKCLAAIAKEQQADIIIMGKQAIDDDCNQTGQMLAALLNWPQATFASKVEFANDKKSLNVTREIDSGLETLNVQLPCVITTDLRLNEPRYATLPNIMQAKRKPLTTHELASLDIDITPRLKVLKVSPPPARKPGKIVRDVQELMHCLRDVEKVI
ncbi:electron transfer flavoprotein subunit beta/FixA family protein [Candidatus Berkiella aquae]|uniref:Electron transfer flavoprotein subunit beta n=1 Tax=Candidatus Berkiella aquae TaxID=295108 RepID=A0A0Q9Z1F4_9GAMM|nr:electron transfer flavoprotein subunit beta/FixA family protein [Candidatus Berkiella aquae]MCS5712423.1 electron transfer flavoprotein subunit beta/FixA family protein [Candidatus Berkiella aquae]